MIDGHQRQRREEISFRTFVRFASAIRPGRHSLCSHCVKDFYFPSTLLTAITPKPWEMPASSTPGNGHSTKRNGTDRNDGNFNQCGSEDYLPVIGRNDGNDLCFGFTASRVKWLKHILSDDKR